MTTTYVALLRGINVGGHKKIAMADLRATFGAIGGEDVTTYIQSGNVICRSRARPAALTEAAEAQLRHDFGFDVDVILRTAAELAAVVDGNPWPGEDDGTKLVVTFLKTPPPADAYDGIDATAFAPEELVVKGRELYLHLPFGQGRSKLTEAIGKLEVSRQNAGTQNAGIPATSRNWKTVTKLLDLAGAGAAGQTRASR